MEYPGLSRDSICQVLLSIEGVHLSKPKCVELGILKIANYNSSWIKIIELFEFAAAFPSENLQVCDALYNKPKTGGADSGPLLPSPWPTTHNKGIKRDPEPYLDALHSAHTVHGVCYIADSANT